MSIKTISLPSGVFPTHYAPPEALQKRIDAAGAARMTKEAELDAALNSGYIVLHAYTGQMDNMLLECYVLWRKNAPDESLDVVSPNLIRNLSRQDFLDSTAQAVADAERVNKIKIDEPPIKKSDTKPIDIQVNKHAEKDAARRAPIQAWAKALVDSGNFIILDTETTGLTKPYPVEIAVIDSSGSVLFDRRIQPPAGIEIEPGAAAVHGITLSSLDGAPTFNAIREDFAATLKDKTILIYNADYDQQVIANGSSGIISLFNTYCVMKRYAEYAGEWNDHHHNYRWHKLTEACRQMGIDVRNQHTALGDCQMTLALLKAMAEGKIPEYEPVPF